MGQNLLIGLLNMSLNSDCIVSNGKIIKVANKTVVAQFDAICLSELRTITYIRITNFLAGI
jgi:hypothetical protein